MKRLTLAAVILSAALPVSPLHAADAAGRFTVKGAGATDCARFNTAVHERGSELVSFAGWLEGYLSAVNRYEQGVYDIAGWRGLEVMLAALARYCAANPAVGFHQAAAEMAGQMRAAAVAEQSGLVTIRNGGDSMVIYREVIRRVQEQLSLRGHYKGAADGEWSDGLAAALTAFQIQKEVPQTGLPDQFILVHLLP